LIREKKGINLMLRKKIETKRLVLEPIQKKYFQDMYNLIKVNNADLSKWLPISYPAKRKETYDFYKKAIIDKNQVQYVIKNKESKAIMGGLGIMKNELNNNATLGYWLAKEYRKKGYMTEAVQAVLHFCFMTEKLMRVEITVHEKNTPSQGVIEKCHLKYEGTKRMAVRNGYKEYGNLRQYSILFFEWKKVISHKV